MRLSTKILTPVAILSLVALLVTATALWSKARVTTATEALTQVNEAALAAAELRSISRALQRDALNLIFEPADGRQAIATRFDKRLESFGATIEQLGRQEAMVPGSDPGAIATAQRPVLAALREVRVLAMEGRSADAHAQFRDRLRASELTDPYIERLQKAVTSLSADLRALERMTRWLLAADCHCLGGDNRRHPAVASGGAERRHPSAGQVDRGDDPAGRQ